MPGKPPIHPAGCCGVLSRSSLTRRNFVAGAGLLAGAAGLARGGQAPGAPRSSSPRPLHLPLRVQPVLVYEVPQRREARSWRSWGGIQTEADAAQEKDRIGSEWAALQKAQPGFPLEVLPLAAVKDSAQAQAITKAGDYDVMLVYAAGGGVRVLEALARPDRWQVMFVRHRSGPVYLWYEIAHPRFLRKTVDDYGQPGMDVDDVVVDSYDEIRWRLRALYAVKNTVGKRIVAVGGPSGWGEGGRQAPEISRDLWKLDIQSVSYPELGERIRRARQDSTLLARTRAEAGSFLKREGVKRETSPHFIDNAFLLAEVLRQLMREAGTDAITINQCMGTIMPIAETTACLPLMLLNDEGAMAFCESDFVVIPSGILLHYISGRPVFLNDPTYPHDGLVTLAHCTAPSRMDGQRYEPVRVLTHFESDYGAAPKVEMRKGQTITVLDPDFSCKRWVGFEGHIVDAPFLAICRSQIDVQMRGDCGRVLREMKGFHWMAAYGNHLREADYALKKLGVALVQA